MSLSLEYYLNSFCSLYLSFYSLSILVLLIGASFFKGNNKTESFNLLYSFNTLAAWTNLLLIINYFTELFVAWYGQNTYEWFAFKSNGSNASGTFFIIINLSALLTGLLFFFRKLRINRLFTLVFLLLHNTFLFERIVIYITGLYRDYLPSSWSYYKTAFLIYLCSYAMIFFLLAFIYKRANKKARLPFPSVFLK